MKKVYIAIAVLVVVLGLVYFKCSSSSQSSSPQIPSQSFPVTVTYYYNPGCPHCRNFMPAWKSFVSGGGANFVEINCSTDAGRCAGVQGVPWVVFSKSGVPDTPFTGNRDVKSLQDFLQSF